MNNETNKTTVTNDKKEILDKINSLRKILMLLTRHELNNLKPSEWIEDTNQIKYSSVSDKGILFEMEFTFIEDQWYVKAHTEHGDYDTYTMSNFELMEYCLIQMKKQLDLLEKLEFNSTKNNQKGIRIKLIKKDGDVVKYECNDYKTDNGVFYIYCDDEIVAYNLDRVSEFYISMNPKEVA